LDLALLLEQSLPQVIFMSETVNVLHHLKELNVAWRKQDFKFTPAQSEEYALLVAARRERVKEFYATGRVCKSNAKPKEVI
jgi:hypothetical protein